MYWNKNKSSTKRQSFLKCEQCNIRSFNNNECLISINYKEWHQVVNSLRKEEKDLILGVPITAYTEPREIVEDCNFEQELNLSEDLTSVHEKLRRKEVIEYYTDRTLEDDSKNIDAERMGIGLVVKEEDIKRLEEETIQLTRLEVLTKLDISLSKTSLKKVIYDIEAEEKLHNQKMHLKGLTSIKHQAIDKLKQNDAIKEKS
ncbi:7285_t:CDS:2, partial [Cetraspora pellucida]